MRGQAAVEYLTTYGWAILALIIVIGLLVSSGIFSPTYLISEECSLSSSLPCQFALTNQGGETRISLGIYNGFAYKIKITDVKVYSSTDGSQFSFAALPADPVESGARADMEGGLGKELPVNSLVRLYANVTYVSCAPEVAVPPADCSTSEHTIVGKITGKIIPGS